MKEKKYYAFSDHETIQAMAHSLFRFQTIAQAQLITNRLAEEFILAPKLSDPGDKKAIVLWVRGMEVTPEEQGLGYLGNFGKISMHKLPSGKWTLTLAKMTVPLNKHPLRKAMPRAHPNWGHPVLRSAQRNKTWPTMKDAVDQLMKLHEEFPEISIPGLDTLKIKVYARAEKGKSPVQRVELKIVRRGEGMYAIEIRNLVKKIAEPLPPVRRADAPVPAPETPPEPVIKGAYTKMVTRQKKRKKK